MKGNKLVNIAGAGILGASLALGCSAAPDPEPEPTGQVDQKLVTPPFAPPPKVCSGGACGSGGCSTRGDACQSNSNCCPGLVCDLSKQLCEVPGSCINSGGSCTGTYELCCSGECLDGLCR